MECNSKNYAKVYFMGSCETTLTTPKILVHPLICFGSDFSLTLGVVYG